jgi:hypothetical protein
VLDRGLERWGGYASKHYYATNPRIVGGPVEKTRKRRLYSPKSYESRRDLGEGQETTNATVSLVRTCAHRNRLAFADSAALEKELGLP